MKQDIRDRINRAMGDIPIVKRRPGRQPKPKIDPELMAIDAMVVADPQTEEEVLHHKWVQSVLEAKRIERAGKAESEDKARKAKERFTARAKEARKEERKARSIAAFRLSLEENRKEDERRAGWKEVKGWWPALDVTGKKGDGRLKG